MRVTRIEKIMKWYKSLDIHARINAKECFVILCGVEFDKLSFLLTMRERIDLMYNKLKIEGFDV